MYCISVSCYASVEDQGLLPISLVSYSNSNCRVLPAALMGTSSSLIFPPRSPVMQHSGVAVMRSNNILHCSWCLYQSSSAASRWSLFCISQTSGFHFEWPVRHFTVALISCCSEVSFAPSISIRGTPTTNVPGLREKRRIKDIFPCTV